MHDYFFSFGLKLKVQKKRQNVILPTETLIDYTGAVLHYIVGWMTNQRFSAKLTFYANVPF